MKKITTFLLAVVISFSACNTEKRAVKRLARLKTEQPTLVASFCGEMFPIKTETKHTVEYREGKTDTIWQNEYIDCDTVIGETRVVKVPYPIQIRTNDTIIERIIEVQENTAKNEAYERRAIQAEERAKHYKKKATRNAFWGVISGMLLTIVSQFIIKR